MIEIWGVVAALTTGALAQDEMAGGAEAPAAEEAAAAVDWSAAIELPRQAEGVRALGVPAEEVASALGSARDSGLSPNEAGDLLQASTEAVTAHGPVEGFGALVQQQLAEGERGPDLAAAIRQAHEERGIGAGKKLGHDKPPTGATVGDGTPAKATAGEDRPQLGAGRPALDAGRAKIGKGKRKHKAKGGDK